jgi:hypothetical protein
MPLSAAARVVYNSLVRMVSAFAAFSTNLN